MAHQEENEVVWFTQYFVKTMALHNDGGPSQAKRGLNEVKNDAPTEWNRFELLVESELETLPLGTGS